MAAKLEDSLQKLNLSPASDGVNHMDKLPDEVLLMIIGILSTNNAFDLIKLGCTCRRLHRLSHHPTLWTHIKLSNGFSSWQQLVQVIAPRMNYGTRCVDLGRKHHRSDGLVKKVWCPRFFSSCPRLEEFYLCNSNLNLANFKHLPASLKVLKLADERQEFRHQDYSQGLSRLRNLTDLELTYNGTYAGVFPTFPKQLEEDLKKGLGPDAKVKVVSDLDGDADGFSDGSDHSYFLYSDDDIYDNNYPYDDFPTRDDWR